MQHLEVSGAVQPIYGSSGVERVMLLWPKMIKMKAFLSLTKLMC